MSERELFEAAYVERYPNIKYLDPDRFSLDDQGEYRRTIVEVSWQMWQAARRTVSGQEAELKLAIAEDQAVMLEKWAKEWEKDQFQRAHDARIIAANLVKLAASIPATELTLDEISAFAERLSNAGYSKQADSLRRILAAAKEG